MKTVLVLGSTGSIGKSTLEVLDRIDSHILCIPVFFVLFEVLK